MLKDYYNILELPAHATLAEIKRAYRRLAMIHHPDRNNNDPYAITRFNEIKEAYEILTNPVRKERWLQERWYDQSIGKKRTEQSITPVAILRLSLELERYVSRLDIHRMNKEGLAEYIDELISADTIEILRSFNEPAVTRQIVGTLLMAMKALPLKSVKRVLPRLELLAGDDEIAAEHIKNLLLQKKKALLWERYRILVVLVLTLLICILIFLTTK